MSSKGPRFLIVLLALAALGGLGLLALMVSRRVGPPTAISIAPPPASDVAVVRATGPASPAPAPDPASAQGPAATSASPPGRAPEQTARPPSRPPPSSAAPAADAPAAPVDPTPPTPPTPASKFASSLSEPVLMAQLRQAAEHDPELAIQLARAGNRRFPDSPDAPERYSILIHALAAQSQAPSARGEAEYMVNHFAESPWVREIETFSGAHRHRNLRVTDAGVLQSE